MYAHSLPGRGKYRTLRFWEEQMSGGKCPGANILNSNKGYQEYSASGLFGPWTIWHQGALFGPWTIRPLNYSVLGLFLQLDHLA